MSKSHKTRRKRARRLYNLELRQREEHLRKVREWVSNAHERAILAGEAEPYPRPDLRNYFRMRAEAQARKIRRRSRRHLHLV